MSVLFSPVMLLIVMYNFKMFGHNPSAKHEPSGGQYLQLLSGILKDLYNQTVIVSSDDIFHVRFPNIFVHYPLGERGTGNKSWTNWNKAPLRLRKAQLNFAVFC